MSQQGGLQDYGYQYNRGTYTDYIVIHNVTGGLVEGGRVPVLDALGIRQLPPESTESNGYKIYPDSAMTGWTKIDPEAPDLMQEVVAVAADTVTGDGTPLVDVLKAQGVAVAGLSTGRYGGGTGRRASGR